MGMIAAPRMTAALLGGSMSTAQLETMLNTPQGLAAWKLCAATDALARPLATDPAARAVWLASTKAMDAMAPLSEYGADAIAQSTTHIQAIFNTSARADAWFANTTTRAAIWKSDKALLALQGSVTGKARARACEKYLTRTESTQAATPKTFAVPLDSSTGRFIMIAWSAGITASVTMHSRRGGSNAGNAVQALAGGADVDNVMALNGPVRVATSANTTVSIGVLEV